MTRRFFRPYYVLNALLLASYGAMRHFVVAGDFTYAQIAGPAALRQWELRVMGVLALAMGIHGLKARLQRAKSHDP